MHGGTGFAMMRQALWGGDRRHVADGYAPAAGHPTKEVTDVRSGLQVRPAQPHDLSVLVDLCLEARAESVVGAQLCSSDPDSLRHQLGALLATPGGLALLGVVDGSPAGLLIARLVGPCVFTEAVHLALEAVYVESRVRRHGLGHALVAAAVDIAEQGGARDVYASSLPGARGMLRFFARLGFAPAAAHRVVSVSALQRRLAVDPGHGAGARRSTRAIEDLIARRRLVRAASTSLAAAHATRQPDTDQPRTSAMSMHVNRAVASRCASESSTTMS
jgi:GNAT superfamily N-acetyltransferase